MSRFYCPDADLNQKTIEITNLKEIHHLKNVLRLKAGDSIEIFNQQGEEISATILKFEKAKLIVQKVTEIVRPPQKSTYLQLACAIPKKAKFEFIIEKATELNVDSIVPLMTRRTEISLDAKRAAGKRERYQTVAVNAAKQCQRKTVPHIQEITELKNFLQSIPSSALALIPCLAGQRKTLFEIFKHRKLPEQIIILIGPEGDFTDEELALALKSGCQPVTLGPTVLKVDTAALATVAWIQLYLDHGSKQN